MKSTIIFYGPFPKKNRVGGYERCNSAIVTSFLTEYYDFIPLKIYSIPLSGSWKVLFYPLSFFLGCLVDSLKLIYLIKRKKPTIIHITSLYKWHIFREWIIVNISLFFNIKVLFDIRAGRFDTLYYKTNFIFKFFTKNIIKNSFSITVEGKRYIDFIQKEFIRTAYYLPNFINTTDSKVSPRDYCKNDICKLFFAGRIVREKGIEELLLGLEGVVPKFNIKLLLAGSIENTYKEYLFNKFPVLFKEGIIVFLGVLDLDQLLKEMRDSDIFLLPSKHKGEGHSNAVNEAMYAGLPLIVSNQGFLSDLVTLETGIVIDEVNAKNIENAIISICSDKKLLKNMGEKSRKMVIENYSDSVVLGSLKEIYRKIIVG